MYLANDINNLGQVVGQGIDDSATPRARGFIWENGAATPLEVFAPDAREEWAIAINDVGQIIGKSRLGDTTATVHGVVWERDLAGPLRVAASMSGSAHSWPQTAARRRRSTTRPYLGPGARIPTRAPGPT